MWSQSLRGSHSCGHRSTSAPWAVFGRMSHGKKYIYPQSSSCLFRWPVWPCSEKQRRGEGTGRHFYSNPAESPHFLQIFRQSEKPHAGGRWSYLPVLQGSQAPVPGPVPAQLPASSAFCFKRGTTHSNTQKPCHFMSPGTCCLFVKGSSSLSASKHLFFPPDLAHASSVLQDPCPPSPHSPLCAITCLQTCFHPNQA